MGITIVGGDSIIVLSQPYKNDACEWNLVERHSPIGTHMVRHASARQLHTARDERRVTTPSDE